jgi:hypothetical protein
MFRLPRRRGSVRRARAATSRPDTGLQVCSGCHADHVHPVEWHESGEDHWWMLLRCGTCRGESEVTVSNDVAERYGRDLDDALEVIARAARVLDAERLAREADAFAKALERDLIDADDFARPLER